MWLMYRQGDRANETGLTAHNAEVLRVVRSHSGKFALNVDGRNVKEYDTAGDAEKELRMIFKLIEDGERVYTLT